MELTRKLRRVGGSVMLPIPPEVMRESGLAAGQEVLLKSRPGHIDIQSVTLPSTEALDFAQRFSTKYREALAELARS